MVVQPASLLPLPRVNNMSTLTEAKVRIAQLESELATTNAALTELRDIVRTVCLEALDADEARRVLLSFAAKADSPTELLDLTRALAALNH